MSKPYLALGLSGPHLIELTSNPKLLERWDELPLAFSVLGIDRVDGSNPASASLESSAVGAKLSAATKTGRFLITATPQRDYPYNIARRVASLGHLSRGRSGILIGAHDKYKPDYFNQTNGSHGEENPSFLSDKERLAYDTAIIVRKLEQSWPYDTIVGDREAGVLIESNRIRYVDIENSFSVSGPLTVPEPQTGASVIACYSNKEEPLAANGKKDPVDIVVGKSGNVKVVSSRELSRPDGIQGVLFKGELDKGVAELLDIAEKWLVHDFASIASGDSLRNALKLPPAEFLISKGREAFPPPKNHPSL